MELMLLRQFQTNVLRQLDYIAFSFSDVHVANERLQTMLVVLDAAGRSQDTARRQMLAPQRDELAHRIWFALQNELNAAAMVSKLLWGGSDNPNSEAERVPLRESIGVSDDSPLRNRNMRNNFEHLDDRLDRWWRKSEQHIIVDGPINTGDHDTRLVAGLPDKWSQFREVNMTTGKLVFWGDEFNFIQIAVEAARLRPIVAVEAAKPHWEPPEESESTEGGGQ